MLNPKLDVKIRPIIITKAYIGTIFLFRITIPSIREMIINATFKVVYCMIRLCAPKTKNDTQAVMNNIPTIECIEVPCVRIHRIIGPLKQLKHQLNRENGIYIVLKLI